MKGKVLGERFNEGYRDSAVYEAVLPPHIYGGVEDTELVSDLLRRLLGEPKGTFAAGLEVGCGPGRVTEVLAPYVETLIGADKSAGMTKTFSERFPSAEVLTLDTEALVHHLLSLGLAHTFSVIGAFWSLSYPLLECFEETASDGVHVVSDAKNGRARADAIVDGLVELLAPEGILTGLFFDAETAEQRFVTEVWERVHPFPGTGRGYTWEILRGRLSHLERSGLGRLLEMRIPGQVLLNDLDHGRDWFEIEHFNSHPALLGDPRTREDVDAIIARYAADDGTVALPTGVRIFAFQRTAALDPPAFRRLLAGHSEC